MMRSVLLIAAVAGALTLTAAGLGGAAAAQALVATKAKPGRALILLGAQEVDPAQILPAPPVAGSDRASAEIAELKRLAATVSPARKAQAKWDDDHQDPSMFRPIFGSAFDLARLPATAALLKLVQTDAGVSAGAAKTLFARKRPWAIDPAIKTCDPADNPLASYPSGHAMLGYSLALTLAQVMPEKAQMILSRADDYAYSREICGSHFPSDTQASQALASVMVTRLLAKPEFQAKIAAARQELVDAGIAVP
jgi:acid phosphatase (class A)